MSENFEKTESYRSEAKAEQLSSQPGGPNLFSGSNRNLEY